LSPFRWSGIVRVAGALTILVAFGRLLGFVREMITARQFGVGPELDAYLLANTLPGIVVTALPEALAVAFVPFLTTSLARGGSLREGAWRLGLPLFGVSVVVACVMFAFAGPIMAALSQSSDRPALLGSVGMLQVLSLSVPLAALVGIGAAACNASGRFHLPALHGTVFNVVVLSCLFLRPFKVSSLAYGVLGGLALQAVLQLWVASRPRPAESRGETKVGAAYRALAPVLFYTALIQVNTAMNRALASGVGVGAISALNYATVLINLPASLFAASFATVLLQRFSLMKANGQQEAAAGGLIRAAMGTVLLTLPIALLTAVLAGPLVHGVFAHGRFTAEAATRCAEALMWLSPTVVAVSLIHLAVRYLNSQGRAGELWLLALWSVGINLGIKLVLVRFFGLNGIAAGTSVATLVTAAWMLWAAEPKHVRRHVACLIRRPTAEDAIREKAVLVE
jgi:putative peptidoglycan lipid II flippase